MKKITIISLALLFVLVLACRKEKPPFDLSDKDPCSCASEVSAEFKIEEWVITNPTAIWDETDTCNRISIMRFSALENDANCKWYIGNQIVNAQVVTRNFSSAWVAGDIPITLVVNKEPNRICFPNDDGYDSITKTFYVSQYPIYDYENHEIHHPLEGVYRVIGSHLTDSIDVTLNMRLNPTTAAGFVDVLNADGSGLMCTEAYGSGSRGLNYLSFRRMSFGFFTQGSTSFCEAISGNLRKDENGNAELNFKLNHGNPLIEIQWMLKGRKL